MKIRLERCNVCNEETFHNIGKKQATAPRGGYTRRKISKCRKCGTKEINNTKQGRRIIQGKNEIRVVKE